LYYKQVGISDEELALMHAIDRIYTKWPAFGYRRITAMLHEEGYQVNRKRVRRLMRKMGISAIYPGPNLSRRNKQHLTYPYLLRNLEIVRPNQVWEVDVTYLTQLSQLEI
jgi:putative transposase